MIARSVWLMLAECLEKYRDYTQGTYGLSSVLQQIQDMTCYERKLRLTQKSLIFEPVCALYLYLSRVCLMFLESLPEITRDMLWGLKTGCYDTGSFYSVPWCLVI